jgi:1-deoxy-D-xylulose-5-phosphate reductoisomerase
MTPKRVLLLGSTGSIGTSTVSVVENLGDEIQLVALAAHRQWEKVLEQVKRFAPESVALTDPDAADRLGAALAGLPASVLPRRPRLYRGEAGLTAMVRETDGDVIVAAISGAAGLPANIAGLETGKDLALANKESLVLSGALLTELARRHSRLILPVDSEHSAIFQSLLSGRREEVESIILTASGGPFRNATAARMRSATREEALKHPTWNMGAKITIDSATLMNKALEIIEAHWLFGLPPDRIRVLIHPQSIIHSLVEFRDGSMICQLGPPDMAIPIQYALTYPARRFLPVRRLRLEEVQALTFFPPDTERFPALRLAYEVLRDGGTAPAVLNAANEVSVAAFLEDRIAFPEIVSCVERTLAAHCTTIEPNIEQLLAADRWARGEASRQVRMAGGAVLESARGASRNARTGSE